MISKGNILKLNTRQVIYNFISKNPGMHLSELFRRIGIPKTTLLYYIRHLEKLELIKEVNKECYKMIFVSHKMSIQNKKLLNLLRQRIPIRIYIHMLYNFVCSRIQLSKELELPPVTVKYYLKKMLEIGLIDKAEMENGIVYHKPKLD
jgi:predicted transcriptional regulator